MRYFKGPGGSELPAHVVAPKLVLTPAAWLRRLVDVDPFWLLHKWLALAVGGFKLSIFLARLRHKTLICLLLGLVLEVVSTSGTARVP